MMVRCAICNREVLPSNAFRCNNCEIWICKSHFGLFASLTCPKCRRKLI